MVNEASYIAFLDQFKEYIVEYVRKNSEKLTIYEHKITNIPITLFKDQDTSMRLIVKNQGEKPVYMTTDKRSGYRLDPNESHELYINTPVTFVCVDGESLLGFISN